MWSVAHMLIFHLLKFLMVYSRIKGHETVAENMADIPSWCMQATWCNWLKQANIFLTDIFASLQHAKMVSKFSTKVGCTMRLLMLWVAAVTDIYVILNIYVLLWTMCWLVIKTLGLCLKMETQWWNTWQLATVDHFYKQLFG